MNQQPEALVWIPLMVDFPGLPVVQLVCLVAAWVLTGVLCAVTLRTVVELIVARPQFSLRGLLLFMFGVAVDLTLFTVARPIY